MANRYTRIILESKAVRPVLNEISDSSNEVYYDRDIIVLANPEMAGLPKWVIALVMAGCVAAALSTAVFRLLLVLSTSVSHDLMKKILKPDISDQQEIRYADRLFWCPCHSCLLRDQSTVSFVAKTVAFFRTGSLLLLPHFNYGNLFQKINKQGAIGMICGIGFTLGYIVHFQFLTDSGTIGFWYFARGYWVPRNVYQFHYRLCG